MATWRQALEVAVTDEEVARLMVLSRSRTEPASRVQRAQMLLAYRENTMPPRDPDDEEDEEDEDEEDDSADDPQVVREPDED
jgi:hypothetical protein